MFSLVLFLDFEVSIFLRQIRVIDLINLLHFSIYFYAFIISYISYDEI